MTFYPQPVPHPLIRQSHIVKIAVQFDPSLADFIPRLELTEQSIKQRTAEFYSLNQNLPLSETISDLASKFDIQAEPSDVSLQWQPKQAGESIVFVTSQNVYDVRDGDVLLFTGSPTVICEHILGKLRAASSAEAKEALLKRFEAYLFDATFAKYFHLTGAFRFAVDSVADEFTSGACLCHLLCCVSSAVDSASTSAAGADGGASWNDVSEQFVGRVGSLVTGRAKHEHQPTLIAALAVLEAVVTNSDVHSEAVRNEVRFEMLIRHLEHSHPNVQKNTLGLMNALFTYADSLTARCDIAKLLTGGPVRNALEKNVLKRADEAIRHRIGTMQRLVFNLLADSRARQSLSGSDETESAKLEQLRQSVFEGETRSPRLKARDSQSARNQKTKHFKALGFVNFEKPSIDIDAEIPPGLLALDCMVFYARENSDNLKSIVTANSLRTDNGGCPFAAASIQLAKELASILEIDLPPASQGQKYHEMLLKVERPFEEFFCVCLKLVYKTWREMHASVEDLPKVISVVREQVVRGLASPSICDLKAFQKELTKYNYNEIQSIWRRERSLKEEAELHTETIKELKEQLRPEIVELVKANRIAAMKRGATFTKPPKTKNSREKARYCHLRLSQNDRILFYADCEENTTPSNLEQITQKLPVSDIQMVLVGNECPHVKELTKGNKRATFGNAFSLIVDGKEPYNFLCSDINEYDLWVDGLRALRHEPMTSTQAMTDVDTLLKWELRICMLDLDGVTLPDAGPAPPVNAPPPYPPPPPPSNLPLPPSTS